jgi:hypothetical protein
MAHPQVPLVRAFVGDDIVITDGNQRAVVQHRDEHEHEHRQLEEVGPDTLKTPNAAISQHASIELVNPRLGSLTGQGTAVQQMSPSARVTLPHQCIWI